MEFILLVSLGYLILLVGTSISCYSFGKSRGMRWGYQQGLRVADAYKQQLEQLEGAIKNG